MVTINIYFNRQYQKFHARIYHKGRYFHVGRYDDELTARIQASAALANFNPAEEQPEEDPIYREIAELISHPM